MTFYKALKLKSGDIIAAKVEQDLKTSDVVNVRIVKVSDPISFNSFKFMDDEGELVETISMAPLIPISMDEELELNADHIFSVATMSESAANRYQKFVDHIRQLDKEDLEEAEELKIETNEDDEVVDMKIVSNNKHLH